MKPVKLFYLRSCPFCKKALRYIDEARAAHPELAAVGIEMIEVFCRLSRPLPGCCCLPGRKSR